MVESEDQLKTVGDYKPSSGGSSPAPVDSAPPPPPPKASSPTASKPSAAPPARPSGDRVFASPAARKLAEDKNVRLANPFSCTCFMNVFVFLFLITSRCILSFE